MGDWETYKITVTLLDDSSFCVTGQGHCEADCLEWFTCKGLFRRSQDVFVPLSNVRSIQVCKLR